MSYITDISTALPKRTIRQQDFAEYYSSCTDDALVKRQINLVCKRSGIDKRHTVVQDLSTLNSQSIDDTMQSFHNQASILAIEAVKGLQLTSVQLHEITDLIMISCTGMQAPGLEFDLIKHFDLSTDIRRYNINFMGCYAAITGLRMAKDICSSPGRKVLLVSVELCTLHFQQVFHPDYILSNSLFADGAAAAVISSEANKGLHLDDSASRIIPNSEKDMSWRISPNGFLMTLSNEIPNFIKELITNDNLYKRDLKPLQWAVHPGGRQILDSIETAMDLDKTKLQFSREVLRDHGNMSSATILFILQKFLYSSDDQEDIIACAFGPGLTFESLILHVVN